MLQLQLSRQHMPMVGLVRVYRVRAVNILLNPCAHHDALQFNIRAPSTGTGYNIRILGGLRIQHVIKLSKTIIIVCGARRVVRLRAG